jgi:type 2 lantibiotic biosynthesis protein LanM
MIVTQEDLVKIIENSSTLSERLSDSFVPKLIDNSVAEDLVYSRLDSWLKIVGRKNYEVFNKRLKWDDLTINNAKNIISEVKLKNTSQLPHWTNTIKEILEVTTIDPDIYNCLDEENPVPFEEIYLPFIHFAQSQLIAQARKNWNLLGKPARNSFKRQLLVNLKRISVKTLMLEFSILKLKNQKISVFLFRQQTEGQTNNKFVNQQYKSFINELKSGGLLSLFKKYSVLARLVAITVELWIEEKLEFLQRLANDLPLIQKTFAQELSQVAKVNLNLSDFHHKGRSVIALEFATGLKLIYKPRTLGLEKVYFQLLSWFNQDKALLPFKIVEVIDCHTHGWMEYVENLPCSDEAAVRRYYQRAGMHLCLIYLLEGSDCHQENLIASGEHPVLIDLETLLHPEPSMVDPSAKEEAQDQAGSQFFDSVLNTGLLPRWDFESNGAMTDISGLGGINSEALGKKQKWQNINTDSMKLVSVWDKTTKTNNAPFSENRIFAPNSYLDEIVSGFHQMYQLLLTQKDTLSGEIANNTFIEAFARQNARFLFRPTQVYSHLLEKTLQPKFLQSGIDRSIEFETLSRPLLSGEKKPLVWSLLEVEQKAMEEMDIPYFTSNSSSDVLKINSDIAITGYFKGSSYDKVISRLKNLNQEDLEQQIAIIRASFCSQANHNSQNDDLASKNHYTLDKIEILSNQQIINSVIKIGEELENKAIRASDNSVTWIGMGYAQKAKRMLFQPINYSLYDGSCGIALFLSALAKVTQKEKFSDLALSSLSSLRKNLHNNNPNTLNKFQKQTGIGGGVGLGSIVYSLVKISQLLEKPELIKDAEQAATLITPEAIESDRKFDLMMGSAGTILSLLSLFQLNHDPKILQHITMCGEHLLQHRTRSKSGLRAWATLDEKLATGLSHGAAGIAHSLLQLANITHHTHFREAAKEAIEFERSQYSSTHKNWLQVENGSSCGISWCHGAPGIALARLASLSSLDDEDIRREIKIALETTNKVGIQNIDHLCCGNFGRMETLLVAAQKLSRSELKETVFRQATQVIDRAQKRGSFYLFPEVAGDIYNPGFFQGMAGIGYQLLRLAYPDLLPCVLLWE